LWRGPSIGADAVVRLALRCSVPRCVALATPALVVPTKAPTTAKNPMKATSTREAVARAARDALGVDDIDETASLSDLGMDSLAGAEFVADLSRRLGRAVAPSLLIECDTVDAIVSALGEDDVVEEVVEEVVQEPRSRRLACAPSSKDQELLLWMLRRARTRSIKPGYAWLPPTAVGLLEGSLNVEALEGALAQVVEAHDALCSRLVEVPGANKALVVFGVDEKPKLLIKTATTVDEAKGMAQSFHDSTTNDPYESTSLLRALLISTPSQEHVLYLSCNHAITDGWSHQILYGELVRAYNARLQGSEAPFGHEERPYAAWLSDQSNYVNEGRKRRYARCARLPAWPQLSTTDVLFETGSLLRNAIAKVLPKEILDNVKRRLSPKCSLPSVVLAAYAHALGRAARGEASVVQYSHPGRTKLDRRTYGQLATDANVLLDDLSAAPTLGAFAESVHRAVLEALAHPTPYADDYVACTNGREAPLPAQYNWYDRYGDVPQWSGITRATELSLDSSSLSQKTFNIGAVYLMALVQGDGALKLVCYFNDAFYARHTILDALGDVSSFLARFAEDPSLSLPALSAGESNGAGARE
jgi:acyl carrier protein